MKSIDNTTTKLGYVTHLECLSCGEIYTLEKLKKEQGTILVNICYDVCMGPLDVKYDYDKISKILTKSELNKRPDTYWKLRELLPADKILVAKNRTFSPLVKSKSIAKELGIELYLKLDSTELFPTRSFKDRPVAMAFNKALEAGYEQVYVASTGNLAIASAYQSRESGIKCKVYVPKTLGEIKKSAIREYLTSSENLLELPLSYDDCNIKSMNDCEKVNDEEIKQGKKLTFVPNNSFRPYYKEGSKTAGTEIALQLQNEIDESETLNIVYPLGSGALFCSAYKGIKELINIGIYNNPVRMFGVQPEICAPIINAIGKDDIEPIKNPQTIAKSIAIGKPGSAHQTLAIIKECKGNGWKVSEQDIFKSTLDLYFKEGIFGQFVAGVTIAGIIKGVQSGDIKQGEVVVANITGTGINRIEDDLLEYSKVFGYEDEVKRILLEEDAEMLE
mgnify:CR=1 FL=1